MEMGPIMAENHRIHRCLGNMRDEILPVAVVHFSSCTGIYPPSLLQVTMDDDQFDQKGEVSVVDFNFPTLEY
jgi:hypothetical protein